MVAAAQPLAWRSRITGYAEVDPRQLQANPRNWRQHPDTQRLALEGILSEVGWVSEVLVNKRTGLVVDGHLRVASALKRNEPTVPVRYVDLDDAEERLVLATLDPITAMATTNQDILDDLLRGVSTNDDALQALLTNLATPQPKQLNPDDADLTPPDEPITQPGDLWLLGEHRLLCGDSTSAADVERVLDGARPRLLVTDPPYGVELDMEWRDRAGHNEMAPASRSYMKIAMAGKGISGDTRGDWADAYALVPSLSIAYVWHATAHLIEVGQGLERIGFELRQQIIWFKSVWAMSRSAYHWQHEPCWYAVRKGSTATWRGDHQQTTVWEAASPKHIMGGSLEEKVDHPTQKPSVLYERPIDNHLETGEPCYEPFAGSGTAFIASERLDRVCFGLEIEPRFCDVIVRRWERVSGRQATKSTA